MSDTSFRSPLYPILNREQWKEHIRTAGEFEGDPYARLERVFDTSYSVITSELLDELVKFIGDKQVFEVGAGSGYLARLLADRNVKIRAIDSREGQNTRDQWWERSLYFNVEKLDHMDFEEFPGEIVLMCWPCISEFAYEVASKMRPGQILIYHGESQGGCTASPNFFKYLRNGPFHKLNFDDVDDAGISEVNMQDFWNAYIKH